MQTYKLILPEHLNHYGSLFGGYMLQWVDEAAWMAASMDYPGCDLVTVAMDRVEFHQGVKEGAIIRFDVERCRVGNSSVQYQVEVHAVNVEQGGSSTVFSTHVTFVRVDGEGNKQALPPPKSGSV